MIRALAGLALALPVATPVAAASADQATEQATDQATESTVHATKTVDVASLVERAQAGEARAFAVLYQRFARAVHAVALAKLAAADAHDVVQDVFAQAHQQLGELREPAAFPGWIMTLARRRAIDAQRLEISRRRRHDGEPASQATAPHPALALDAHRALTAIRALPESYAEILLMRLVEDLDGYEIAERTGLTPGSVRVTLHRGMTMLRAALQGGEP